MPSSAGTIRVAAIIPVYHARFLAEALDSVFGQSRLPDDVIVIDDGSPDRHLIGSAISGRAFPVRLLTQPNAGAGAARNRGLLATDADWIAFLDADDKWLPSFLETQLTELGTHPASSVVYADARYVGTTPLAGKRFMEVCPSRGKVTPTSLLALRCHIPMSTVVAHRRTVLDAGGFDATLRRGQDFDLWLRLALRGAQFHYHDGILMEHRIHDGNLSGTDMTRMERGAAVFRKAMRSLPLSRGDRRIAEKQVLRFEAAIAVEQGKALLTRGDFEAAHAHLSRARRTLKGWKVRAALLGLRVAPHLLRRMLLARGSA